MSNLQSLSEDLDAAYEAVDDCYLEVEDFDDDEEYQAAETLNDYMFEAIDNIRDAINHLAECRKRGLLGGDGR